MKYIINHIYSFIILTLIGIFFYPAELLAQTDKTATVRGVIYDGEEAGEPLIGSNVILNNGDGAATDFNGAYSFNAKPGSYTITVKYIGYQTQTKNIRLSAGETKEFSLTLMPESNQLDDVVISASKYEQKLGDVPVSMAVIKPALIENKATRDAQAIVEQVPGVQINENQVSIRGGSGWSYGAGSRVLVMVDGMPMLAGDANDVKWSAIPLENISQIEILKGASSVLYGSSALNGVINIRTQYPKDKPVTKVNISNGFYNNGYASRMGTSLISGDSVLDQRSDQTWWDSPRGYIQGNFTHLRKLSENDELVLGGFFMKDQGYRFGENDQRARINGGWKHFSKKINGLSYGLNLNNNFNNSTIFFLWAGADSVLHALGGVDTATTTMSKSSSSRIMIDPYISYVNKNGKEHHLKARFFRTDNQNNTNQAATSNYYFGEYQFQQRFENKFTITSGAMSSYTDVISELYGNHTSTNLAAYFQGYKKWEKFNLTAGMRLEYFKIDSVQSEGKLFTKDLNIPFQPVFRIGSTYQPAEYTFLRASYGQGYRFPSIAEKYISTFVGGLNIFPNNNIQPEYGWSAEIGLKQGFKINN
ncbi:MAG: TonB-dependent receptor, partial [Bacteroidota bacterium]|nr:TonB-dependent receptor [Bacteroidota bacterium]